MKVTMTKIRILLLLVAVAALAVVPGARADEGFEAGPSGGDGQNYKSVDPATGRVTVVRHNPAPGAVNCGGSGGYAYLKAARPSDGARAIVVGYAEAVVDPYTWISVEVLDGSGRWVGSARERGPIAALEGTITVPLDEPVTSVIVHVGLQVASACPNVDGGTVRFTSVAAQ